MPITPYLEINQNYCKSQQMLCGFASKKGECVAQEGVVDDRFEEETDAVQ